MNLQKTKVACLLVLSVWAVNSFAVTTYNQRVTKVIYDFDNNGVTDATDVYNYNSSGLLADTSYIYTGDSAADKLNTRDSNSTHETNTFSYNADGLLEHFVVDRGSQVIESSLVFLAGQLNRADLEVKNGVGTLLVHHHWDFIYSNNDLTQVQNFDTLSGNAVSTLDFVYGSNGLPSAMDQSSPPPGLNFANTFSWRIDKQIDTISTVTSGGQGTGNVDLFYDGQNRLSSELWSFTGNVGSPYASPQRTNYRKSYFYNTENLKIREEFDLDDNGSVDAVLTYEWEGNTCIPSFYWAPNGMPNFITSSEYPYVAGTGAFQIKICGGTPASPTNVPIPLWSSILLGLGLLGISVHWKNTRLKTRHK